MLELVRTAQEQLMVDLVSKDRQANEAYEKLFMFKAPPYALSDKLRRPSISLSSATCSTLSLRWRSLR